MTKTRSLTKTQVYRGAFVDTPHYAYYAKKFYCLCCKKREYAQVLNINEINEDMGQQRYEELKERYFQEDTE